MGADIHSKIEIKENGKWRLNTDAVFLDPYDGKYNEDGAKFNPHPGDGRNYDWFALLADVRNGRGFAGVQTGCGFIPIADPRGIPPDATEEWKEYVKEWGDDLHSMSWLKLEDFDNYNWNQLAIKIGSISLDQYKQLKGTNKTPELWSGWSSGHTLTMEEADILLEKGSVEYINTDLYSSIFEDKKEDKKYLLILEVEDERINVSYTWTVNYRE